MSYVFVACALDFFHDWKLEAFRWNDVLRIYFIILFFDHTVHYHEHTASYLMNLLLRGLDGYSGYPLLKGRKKLSPWALKVSSCNF